jgi:hypothetical protein
VIDIAPTLAAHGLTIADMLGSLAGAPAERRVAIEKRSAVLRGLAALGYTSAEIGEALGISRASVAGRCRLAGVPLPRSAPKRRHTQAKAPRADMRPRVRLHLIADGRPDATRSGRFKPIERRRWTCASLPACEEDWIAAELAERGITGRQAMCPDACAEYVAR